MNIALTGSSGIIGSKLLTDLKEMGHNVICISSSTSNLKENIYSYEELELIDLNFKIDCLMHLASINSNLLESQVTHELELLKKVMLIMKKIECNNLFKEKYELVQQDIHRAGSVENEEITLSDTEALQLNIVLSAE